MVQALKVLRPLQSSVYILIVILRKIMDFKLSDTLNMSILQTRYHIKSCPCIKIHFMSNIFSFIHRVIYLLFLLQYLVINYLLSSFSDVSRHERPPPFMSSGNVH